MRRRKNGEIVLFCFFKKNRPDADAMILQRKTPRDDARQTEALLNAAAGRPSPAV